MMSFTQRAQFHCLFFIICITQCLAETKWVWDRNYNSDPFITRRNDYKRESLPYRYPEYLQYDRDRIRELERIRDLERQRERDRERHRDREPITVRPYTRPNGQEDFDEYDIDDQKYNYDQYRPDFTSRPYPLPPRPLPPTQNFRPNTQGGVLIGPGGPSGIFSRPNGFIGAGANRLPLTNGLPNPNDLRPNPANGVLVGPGGPTGVIGRPQFGNGGIGTGYPAIPPNGPGSNSYGPQVFPPLPQGINPGSLSGIRPPIAGPGAGNPGALYPNQGQGLYPGNSIYGYPAGSNSGIGGIGVYGNGNLYPGQYTTGAIQQQQQQGQYGFYPSQYYPTGLYGQNSAGNRLPYPYPYNNEIGNDNNNSNNNGYYAPGYDEFGRSANSASNTKDKDKDSIKFEDRKVKKSIDDKLAEI
ncbi:spidroin-2-like [Condylostylus longicornis]|uniref:spidroin-2-like n=1 Tax=Condylostylus longicornis TaxID=2530218 RepID=UPI00244DC77D|nr:spidroin-2-like [Condylostylus longicornis]